MSDKNQERQEGIQISMTYPEAMFLWNMLKDVLTQDQQGKDSGQGGILYPEDVGKAMRLMTPLAQAIDDVNRAAKEKEKKKPTLTLV